ncbi:MAG: MraY family glycosyltransferase [Lautropia sp.]
MPEFSLAALVAKFPWLILVSAAAIALGAVLVLTPLARRVGWTDKPSERKAHVGEIPLIGGWAVLLAMAVPQAVGPAEEVAPTGYWLAVSLLFVVALIDDRFPIRARYRFLVQIAAAVIGCSFGGQMLTGVGDLLGIGVLNHWWISLPVTILGTVAVINAVNFTDGADGLCGGLGFIGLFWFLIAVALATSLAARSGEASLGYATSLIPLAAAMMGGLAGFLWFNLRSPWRAKAAVFLGDSGSMLIGFTLAWFAIHVASAYGAASVPPVVCLWIMAVPLADSASCIVRRLLAGVKPTTPDLKHLHHLIIRLGWTPGQAVVLIHAGAFFCGLIGVGGWWLGIREHWLFAAFLVSLLVFISYTGYAWRRLDGEKVAEGATARLGA